MTGNTITVDGQELRLVRLTTNRYPITPSGTGWSGDDLVFYAKDHDVAGYVRLIAPTSDPRSSAGFYRDSRDPADHEGWNVERQYVVDVEETTPSTPREIKVGDHVKVTRDSDAPQNEGKSAEVLEVGGAPGIGGKPYRVKYDDGSGYGSWWVDSVELLPEEEEATPEPSSATYSQEDVHRLVSEARNAGRREEEERHQSWLDSLVSDLHDAANENNLCGEFDRFMIAHDLPAREREYEVTLTVRGRVTVTVTAFDSDTAADLAHEEYGEQNSLGDVDVLDVETYDVTVA